jgi:hypothetical protein
VCGAAEEKPVQLSLFTPIQIFPEETSITIFRFNLIYGSNATMTGLDLGLVNRTTSGVSKAFQIGLVNWVEADLVGLQWSPINLVRNNFTGFQSGTVNVVMNDFKGFQWGFFNYSNHARGLQLGFINYTETAYGLQIGLINIIREGGFLPFFPIVNWSF